MIGWQPGDATIFAGVRAVPAATVVTLQHGVLRTEQYVAPLSFARSDAPAPALADAVDEMAAILRGALERSVVDHPDALLQLTGGHDSRILLGAVAPADRRGLHALTLGDGSSRDVSIAADLCRRYGMVHQVHPVDGQAWPSPAGVHQLVLDSLAGPRVPGEPAGVGAVAARRARHRPGPPTVRPRRRGGAGFLLRRPAARRQHVAEPRHAPRPVAAVQQRGGRGRGARPGVPRRGAVHHDGPADDAVPGRGLAACHRRVLPLPADAPMGRCPRDGRHHAPRVGERDVRPPLPRARPGRRSGGQARLAAARTADDAPRPRARRDPARHRARPGPARRANAAHQGRRVALVGAADGPQGLAARPARAPSPGGRGARRRPAARALAACAGRVRAAGIGARHRPLVVAWAAGRGTRRPADYLGLPRQRARSRGPGRRRGAGCSRREPGVAGPS